jgi:hypothetical protein
MKRGKMATEGEKKRQLIAFLDEKVFDPVLNSSPDEFSSAEQKRKFHDLRKSILAEKKRFHERYASARDIRENYLSDIESRTSKRMNAELEELELPRLSQFREEFLSLCESLDV